MIKFAVAYLATAVVFFGLDFIWLWRMLGFYRAQMGPLLLEQPRLGYAGLFYAVYVAGIVGLAVLPATGSGSFWAALGAGALLGLVAYGTYDMTNLSTLRGWPLQLALVDIGWGVVVTAAAATAGYFVMQWLAPAA